MSNYGIGIYILKVETQNCMEFLFGKHLVFGIMRTRDRVAVKIYNYGRTMYQQKQDTDVSKIPRVFSISSRLFYQLIIHILQ